MALKVIWTLQAKKGLYDVVEYLEQEWTAKEVLNLELKISQVIVQIINNPYSYPKSFFFDNLHKAIVDKNNYLVYRVNTLTKKIEIINFRGTKQKTEH